jgi:uncharacterized protein
MDTGRPALEHMPVRECLRLMASVPVGRIIYTRNALPAAELVNFEVDCGDIVIRTACSGKLDTAIANTVVAFETDDAGDASHTGWSVTVVGRSQEITDAGEIARLHGTGIQAWAPGERDHFIRITPGIVTGCRLQAGAWPGSTPGGDHHAAGSRPPASYPPGRAPGR